MTDFTVGAQVQWYGKGGSWSRVPWRGVIVKVSDKGTLTVKPEHAHLQALQFRPLKHSLGNVRRYDCEIVPAHDLALEAWNSAQPKLVHLHIDWGLYGRNSSDTPDIHYPQNHPLTHENLNAVEVELTLLRAWLHARPTRQETP